MTEIPFPRPTIVHLIGNPAVGKYTIGRELARMSGARLVDNHSVANVIFQLLDTDGVTPLPREVWQYVGAVRRAVLDAMKNLAPAHLSFILTNYLRGGDAAERAAFEELAGVAAVRGSLFVPVLLRCETSELVMRVANDDRRQRMKLLDPVAAAQMNDEVPPFETDHPNALSLDTTGTPPAESARRIAAWVLERGT